MLYVKVDASIRRNHHPVLEDNFPDMEMRSKREREMHITLA